ncbi:MAG: metallophosphoesterase [Candidatus Daviesbacteria bacterium]|nr:metallophosphoesterase [Candidatus Daviesbacteria bacterium]
MFKRHYQKRRSTNIVFVIFRLLLSVVMFAVLLGGIYSAYKHFSGLDPLKLDPQAVLSELLAGKVPKEFLQKALGQQKSKEIPVSSQKEVVNETGKNLAFQFLLVADSHSDNADLDKAISQAKTSFPGLKFIIGLGDYTEVGTIDELKAAKAVFDSSALRYFLIPGDHDLWDCRNRSLAPVTCFREVFGPSYQSFVFDNFEFMLLNNSDNYTGFDEGQLQWITNELEKAKQEGVKGIFVFLHEPLYHPSSDHVMGWVEKNLKSQAGGVMSQLKDAGVLKVFAGDIHFFSEYSEPRTNLSMTTIGAATIERNPQAPRFGIVSVFDDGTTKVEDVEIK